MNNKFLRFVLSTVCILFFGWGTALAQDSTILEEIVVTATKRTTVLQDTAYSVQALSSDTLRELVADDFIDFFNEITSLSQFGEGPGNRRYSIRNVQSVGEPQVGLYYDEIPIAGLPGDSLDSGFAQLELKLWDVERIEVLKGPQGTLYGQGSMGGTLRVISKRPDTEKYQAAAQTTLSDTRYGDFNYGVNGMVNVPLIKNVLAVRGAIYHRDEDGYIDDISATLLGVTQDYVEDVNYEETTGGRVSVLFTPTEDFSLTGLYYFQRTDTGGLFETFPDFATGDAPVANVFVENLYDDDVDMFNVIADYDGLGWASATWTGSYMEREIARFDDTTRFVITGVFGCNEFNYFISCFGAPIVPTVSMADESVKSWSTEFRVTSEHEGPFHWTAGFFFQNKRTYRNGQVGIVDGVTGEATFDENRVLQRRIFSRKNWGHAEQLAFFGELGYEVIDGLVATGGVALVRYGSK